MKIFALRLVEWKDNTLQKRSMLPRKLPRKFGYDGETERTCLSLKSVLSLQWWKYTNEWKDDQHARLFSWSIAVDPFFCEQNRARLKKSIGQMDAAQEDLKAGVPDSGVDKEDACY